MAVAVVPIATTEGHFFAYGLAFVEAARRSYEQVIVLLPDLAPPLTAVQAQQLEGLRAKVLRYPSPIPKRGGAPVWWVHIREWLALRQACLATGLSQVHLIIPYLDTMFMGMLLLKPARNVVKLTALTMRGDIGQHRRAHSRSEQLKRSMWERLLRGRRPDVLATNDPLFFERAISPALFSEGGAPSGLEVGVRPGSGRPLAYLPDFSFCHPGSAEPDRADRPPVCLAVGFLDQRKRLSLLAQAVVQVRANGQEPRAQGLVLRLVGALAPDALDEPGRHALAVLAAEGGLEVADGHCSDEAYADAVASADMIWVFYVGHDFGSGVVLDAIAAKRALVAQGHGVIGYYASRYPDAVLLPEDADVEAVARALVTAASRHPAATRSSSEASASPPFDRSDYVNAVANLLSLSAS